MENCIICEGQQFSFIYRDSLKKCNQCGHVAANLNFSEEEFHKLYRKEYFKGEEYLDYVGDKRIIQKNFSARFQKILKFTELKQITNCLEIGCAYGFFAEILLKQVQTKYVGLDVSEEAVAHGTVNSPNLKREDYLNYQSPDEKYTDVFMWDVIEHLKNPDRFIQKIYSEMDNRGRIYITTGDISAILPRIQGKNWRLIHPPTHVHYFSKETLIKLLDRYGFKIVNLSYPPIYRSIKQIFYSLFLLNKKGNLLMRTLYQKLPVNAFLKLNTFDIMMVIAEKKV